MRNLIRRHARKQRDDSAIPGQGELNIIPLLDIVVNLILFLMATTAAVLTISSADAQLREYPGRRPPGHPTLMLTVVLGDEALHVTGNGIVPHRLPRGPDGRYDFAALRGVLAEIKSAHPEEDDVILTADPTVPYEDVIRAMDTARTGPMGPMFGDVLFAGGIR